MKSLLTGVAIVMLCACSSSNSNKASSKNHTDTTTTAERNVKIKENEVLKYVGTYTYGIQSKGSEAPQGIVYIYPKGYNIVQFYIYVNKGAPSYNIGTLEGQMSILDGEGIYEYLHDENISHCKLKFIFKDNNLTVTEVDRDCECDFGYGVYMNHKFERQSSEIPKYYTAITGEKVYFDESIEDNTNKEEPNTRTLIKKTIGDDGILTLEYSDDDGYTTIFERTYPDKTIEQAYHIAKKIEKHLRENLPKHDLKYEIRTDSESLDISYSYKNRNHIHIHLLYEGGDTYIDLIGQGKGTKVIETYSH